jgi:magnesium transporter
MKEYYVKEIVDIIRSESSEVIRNKLSDYHPRDIATALVEMEQSDRTKFFSVFEGKEIGDVVAYLEHDDVLRFFEDMKPRYIANIIQDLDIDDAVDLMQALPDEERVAYLKLMDQEHRETIKSLLRYPKDTAGSIMTTDYIEIDAEDTVEKAMKKLISQAVEAETISTLYVTDDKNVLVGTMSLREIILARKGQNIKDIMNTRLITVPTSMDQEDVAEIFKNYDFTALPVVDKLGRMLGIITIDDIVDVIEEEASEDYSRLAAVSDVEMDSETETVWDGVKKRLPWLLILSGLGFLTSTIIASFQGTLSAVPAIALFMPMILGMAGNTGTQALAVTVRGLNIDEFQNASAIRKHLAREFGTGLLNGLIIASILFAITLGFLHLTGVENALRISEAVSMAIILSLSVTTFAGALIPIIMNTLKIDPAVASGPFVTVVGDLLATSVYFTLATILLIKMV